MEGFIISSGIIALVVIVIVYLFRDSGFFKGIKKIPQNVKEKVDTNIEEKIIQIVEEVKISFRLEKYGPWNEVIMTKSEWRIGSGKNNDLVINDKTVESCHAIIYKRYKENEIYFELVNCAKVNPTKYYHPETKEGEFLKKRQGQELVGNDIFYLGRVKFRISIPEDTYTIPM